FISRPAAEIEPVRAIASIRSARPGPMAVISPIRIRTRGTRRTGGRGGVLGMTMLREARRLFSRTSRPEKSRARFCPRAQQSPVLNSARFAQQPHRHRLVGRHLAFPGMMPKRHQRIEFGEIADHASERNVEGLNAQPADAAIDAVAA